MSNATTSTSTGQAVRLLRQAAGVKLADLATRAGVSTSHLSRFESGERDLSPSTYAHAITALATIAAEAARAKGIE